MFAVAMVLALTLLSPAQVADGLPMSAIPTKEFAKFEKHVNTYFDALNNESKDKDALAKKAKALEAVQKAYAAAARSAKVDQPLKYLGDWDLFLEAIKPEDRDLKSQYGKGFFPHHFSDPWTESSFGCLLSIPASYARAETPLPAILALKAPLRADAGENGGGTTALLQGDELASRVKALATAAYGPLLESHIILVPLGTDTRTGKTLDTVEYAESWFIPDGQVVLFKSLRVLLEQLRFDRSRLVVDGWGDAGIDAVRTATAFPSWFAGVINRSGEIGGPETLYENLTGIPVLYVDGKQDARGADTAGLSARADLKSEVTVLSEEGSALAPSPETQAAIVEWVSKRRMDLAPLVIHQKFSDPRYQSAHWLKGFDIRLRSNGRPEDTDYPRIDARVDSAANKISIETVNVLSLWLYLNDSIVDMDKPVIIEVNGKEHVQRTFTRSLAYMFDNRFYNNSGDYGLYTAERQITEIEPNIPGTSK